MTITARTTATPDEQAQADAEDRARGFERRYPVTADGWVTISRVSVRTGTALVQKRDGATRTVLVRTC